MRIQRRLSNPLLRRVQRHTRISTLFRTSPAEPFPAETPRLPAIPVAVDLPATVSAGTPVSDLVAPPSVPAPAPVQTLPLPAARVPAAIPPAAYAPVAQPPTTAPPAPAPQVDAGKVEEERNWKRLQTIMRKHLEKEQPAQPDVGEAALPTPAEPPPAPDREIREAPAEASPSAPVQRRSSLVEEFPSVPAARQAPPVPPPVTPGNPAKAPLSGVPQPMAPSASEPPVSARPAPAPRALSAPLPLDAPAEPVAQPAPSLQRKLETPPAPESAIPSAPASQPPAAVVPRLVPEEAAVSDAPAVLPVSPVQRHPAPAVPLAPFPKDEALPVQETAPQEKTTRAADLTETPTLQMPRTGLVGEPPPVPVQQEPAEPAAPQEWVAPPAPPAGQPPAPVLQRQPESPVAPTVSEAPVAQPSIPEREPSTSQPRLAKASLAGAQPLQRTPEAQPASQPPAPPPPPAVQGVPPAPVSEPAEFPPDTIAPPAAPVPPISTAPLESIWPVQRLPVAPKPSPAASAEMPAVPETPVVLPHNEHLGKILQSVSPGLPSESSVELVTPRKPRPIAARQPPPARAEVPAKPAEAVRPELPALQRQAVQTEPVAPSPARDEAAPMTGDAAGQPPAITPVPTEIGPLPSDLWSLIDQPAPVPAPVPAVQPAMPVQEAVLPRPPRQSALQRHVEAQEVVQRAAASASPTPAAPQQAEVTGSQEPEPYLEPSPRLVEQPEPEAPADVIQRAVDVGEVISEVEPILPEAQPPVSAPNVEELAQRVYQEIRRRLSVELERWRRG